MEYPVGRGFPTRIDMGQGVTKLSTAEFLAKIEEQLGSKTGRNWGSVANAKIYNPRLIEIKGEVHAKSKYIVFGTLNGGYVRSDPKFGDRVTGHYGGNPKMGLRWAGDKNY